MSKKGNSSKLVVGIDLGGTNMQIGVVDGRHRIIGRERRKTQAREGAEAVIDRIVEGVARACADAGASMKDVAAVGIAAPGAIDIPNGVVLEAPNLKWYDLPLRDILRKKVRCPVVVDNDVNGAVWGEFVLGAGRHHHHNKANELCTDDVLGVWMGTGVGGGIVIDGRLFYGEFFTAGEVGHTILFPCGEKGRRTVEDFCSRTGMCRTIHRRLKDFPNSTLCALTKATDGVIGSQQLADAYRNGDELAVSVVDEAADLLGIAVASWITLLALDVVIIGGGVTEALGRPYLNRIRASFKANVFPKRCRKCKLVMTELKDDAGLLGAALLAREALGAKR
jgi:glucokinase